MTDDWTDPHDDERLFVTALPGSRVQVVEQSTGRLVLFIPGGGLHANALGCFAIIWNAGVGFMAAVVISSMLKQNRPLNGGHAIMGLMVLVGLGIGYYAIRLKFERT